MSEIQYDIPQASWGAYEPLLHNDLNGQVNKNRTLISAIYENLSDLYANANESNATINGDTTDLQIKAIVANAFKGIFDNSKRASDLDFIINENYNINFKRGTAEVKLSEMIDLKNQSLKFTDSKLYIGADEYEIKITDFPTFSEDNGVLRITTGDKIAQISRKVGV